MNLGCYSPAGVFVYFFLQGSLDPECNILLNSGVQSTSVSAFHYLKAFLLTCVLEAPVYFLLFQISKWPFDSKKIIKFFCLVVLLNLATHPVVYFLIPHILAIQNGSYIDMILIAEVFAPVVEAVLLWLFLRRRGFTGAFQKSVLASIVANLFSWWAGIYLL